MKFFDKTWKLALSGAVAGLLVVLLAIYGNPANMAICVACFIRDSAKEPGQKRSHKNHEER